MFFTWQATGFLSWCTIGTALEVQVTPTTSATFGQAQSLTVIGQVSDDLIGIHLMNDGAHWHAQFNIFTSATITIRATTWLTILRQMFFRKTIIHQGIDVSISDRIYASASTTITTIWSAKFNKFFATHRSASRAAMACHYFNTSFVDKFHKIQ